MRGEASKNVEFSYMIQIQQVGAKFITDYDVYAKKPVEHALIEPALVQHREFFGADASELRSRRCS